MSESIDLDKGYLILQEEVKGVGGKEAPRKIFERLLEAFVPEQRDPKNIEI
jgi:DNA sulfur modification protein DndB